MSTGVQNPPIFFNFRAFRSLRLISVSSSSSYIVSSLEADVVLISFSSPGSAENSKHGFGKLSSW